MYLIQYIYLPSYVTDLPSLAALLAAWRLRVCARALRLAHPFARLRLRLRTTELVELEVKS